MIISYRWTAKELCRLENPKTATRRDQPQKTFEKWLKFWKEGKLIHQAWSATPCVSGAILLGEIKLKFPPPYRERISDMTDYDLQKEGGMVDTVEEFIDRYFKGDPDLVVTVISFELYSCNLAARSFYLGETQEKATAD